MAWPSPDTDADLVSTDIAAGTSSPKNARASLLLSMVTAFNNLKALVNSIIAYGDPKVIPPGRLIKVTKYSGAAVGGSMSAVFTPQAATAFLIVEVQAAGSAGQQVSTAASTANARACGGGQAGAYCKALITSGFSSVTVTVGGGGDGSNNSALGGGNSSFGSIVACLGGASPGTVATSGTYPVVSSAGSSSSGITTSGCTVIESVDRAFGGAGVAYASNVGVSGAGANSKLGSGGALVGAYLSTGATSGNDAPAGSFGSGGGGSICMGGTTLRTKSGNGAGGCVIVYEYS